MHSENSRTMRALVQRSLGGPTDLRLSPEHDRPDAPGPGEYLVRVSAAGVNFADVMQTRGTYGDGPLAPYVAGFEAAGVIVAASPDIACPLPVGTHVIGAGRGSFAQYMAMPAVGALVIPTGWRDAEALGLVLNWATALAALRPLGGVARGEVVLIHAAAGGVGQAAVRLAHHYGARVIATASPAKHGVLSALGVETILDSSHPDLAKEVMREAGGRVDLVLESVGAATFGTSLAVTKPFAGRIIVFGASSGDTSLTTRDLVFEHQVQVKGLHVGALAMSAPSIYRALFVELNSLIALGVYPPGIPEVHPLHEGPAVLQALEAGRTHGKHALDPWAQ